MEIKNKQEKQKYLDYHIKEKDIGCYALVTYNNYTKAIYLANLGKSNIKGDNWYLEYPCELREFILNNKKDLKYLKEQGYIIKDDNAYEIDPYQQTAPFLPEVLDDLTLISEEYCLEWMLENRK